MERCSFFRFLRIPPSRNESPMKLNRYVARAAGAIFLASLALAPLGSSPRKTPQFIPPDITSATDIPYPVNSLATGAVTLLLSLDSSGHMQNVQVLRDFPSLTSSVQSAVQNWTFVPASFKGNPVPSELSVTAIFNIFNPAGGAASQSLVLTPLHSTSPDASQFAPPQITLATFATYAADSVSPGTVVLDVTVGKAGQPNQIRVIRDIPTLTQQAIGAVKTWSFNPATIQGQPVAAPIIIAFVFQRNMS
jgi:TonB family protein